jgi:hypothetical protein
MSNSRTHHPRSNLEFENDLFAITSTIISMSQFTTTRNSKHKFKCTVCGYVWSTTPNSVLSGKCGCRNCVNVSRRLGNDQFLIRLADAHQDIRCLDTYVNARTKLKFYHSICDHTWTALPRSVLSGIGCPNCCGKHTKSTWQFIPELYAKFPDIKCIGEYVNGTTPILFEHTSCGTQWEEIPENILRIISGHACPNCSPYGQKSNDKFISQLLLVTGEIICLEEYINSGTKLLVQHSVCGNIWKAWPTHLLQGVGCPACMESKGEKQIRIWLKDHGIPYEPQKRFDGCKRLRILPFDFYLPEINTCIEYQGIQHFEPIDIFGGTVSFEKQKINDDIKRNFCKDNNLRLIEINYKLNVEDHLNQLLLD